MYYNYDRGIGQLAAWLRENHEADPEFAESLAGWDSMLNSTNFDPIYKAVEILATQHGKLAKTSEMLLIVWLADQGLAEPSINQLIEVYGLKEVEANG